MLRCAKANFWRCQGPSLYYSNNTPILWGLSSLLLRLQRSNRQLLLRLLLSVSGNRTDAPVPVPIKGGWGFPQPRRKQQVLPSISLNVGKSFVTVEEDHICTTYVTWLQKPEETRLISHTCSFSSRCILGNATVSQAQRGTSSERVSQKVKWTQLHSWTSTRV